MRETISKHHNNYWVWDYGAVVPFILDYYDGDGDLYKKPKAIIKTHIGREELEEYIEVLQYALSKRKQWEKENLSNSKLNSFTDNNDFMAQAEEKDWKGEGKEISKVLDTIDNKKPSPKPCHDCNGNGVVAVNKEKSAIVECPTCDGQGFIKS